MHMRIHLRDVSLDDSAILHEWRNEPSIRAVSINSESIEIIDHVEWLRGRIEKCKSNPFWIVLLDDQLAGYVRFDRTLDADNIFEVSVLLDQVFRGQGVGALVLKYAFQKILEEFGECTIIAEVSTNNIASLNIFVELGFQPLTLVNHFLKFSKKIEFDN
jgi:RimJ/RimL family protein N-acetyltransferase